MLELLIFDFEDLLRWLTRAAAEGVAVVADEVSIVGAVQVQGLRESII